MIRTTKSVYVDAEAWNKCQDLRLNCSEICELALQKAAELGLPSLQAKATEIDKKLEDLEFQKSIIEQTKQDQETERQKLVNDFLTSTGNILSDEALTYWSTKTGVSKGELLAIKHEHFKKAKL
jgi:hypothetical protein